MIFTSFALSAQDSCFVQYGKATYYHKRFEGRKTSNGEKFTHKKLTAAHHDLPFNTLLKVTNLENDKTVIVRVNDRMPRSTRKSNLDLTYAAALELDMIRSGRIDVRIEIADTLKMDSLSAAPPALVVANTKNKKENLSIKKQALKIEASVKAIKDSLNTAFLDTSLNNFDPEGFGVQVLSYNSLKKAHLEALRLSKKFNETISIQKIEIKGSLYYRIILGQCSDSDNLLALKKKLSKDYKDCFAMKFSQ